MKFVSDAIDLWPSADEFAVDVGVQLSLVRVWKHRKSIPADRWARIEAKAVERGFGVAPGDLSRLAASRSGVSV